MSRRPPGHQWNFLLLKLGAVVALMLGRRGRAEQLFGQMIDNCPTNPYALASRAHVRAQAGRHDEALVDARALVAAHPNRGASDWFNLAYLLEATNRPQEAEPAFRRALELDPKLDRAWYGLGLVLIRLHRLDDAVAALKRNTELQPMSPYGWYQLARAHLDRHEPEEARKVIRHLKAFEPKVAAQLERETGLAA